MKVKHQKTKNNSRTNNKTKQEKSINDSGKNNTKSITKHYTNIR